MGWDLGACATEPYNGELTVAGVPTITLDLDGETTCDGWSSYSGDQQGDVEWRLSG